MAFILSLDVGRSTYSYFRLAEQTHKGNLLVKVIGMFIIEKQTFQPTRHQPHVHTTETFTLNDFLHVHS